jgi:hypothetical protein
MFDAEPDGSFSAAEVEDICEIVMHEIGHNWDEEYDKYGWRECSGWVYFGTLDFCNLYATGRAVQGDDASGLWYYDSAAAGFVSSYADHNPCEDFAESFSNYFMNIGGYTFSGTTDISAIPEKQDFFDDFVHDIS